MINLNDKKSKGTHWVSIFIGRNTTIYFNFFEIEYMPLEVLNKVRDKFDSFGIEHMPLEVLNKVRDKSMTHNIFRIQDNESTRCWFMVAGKTLLDYTNLFSLNS